MKAKHIRKLRKQIQSKCYWTKRLDNWLDIRDRLKILYYQDDKDSEFTRYPIEKYKREQEIAEARIKWYNWKLVTSSNPNLWDNPYKITEV